MTESTVEINESVARKLGWRLSDEIHDHSFLTSCYSHWCNGQEGSAKVKDYAGSIQASWEIVGFVNSKFLLMKIEQELGNAEWSVIIRHNDPTMQNKYYGRADTAPMAICKAFLKLP
jgi:predicted Zn-dependent protease